LFDLVDSCERALLVGKGKVAAWTYWQNHPSRNYTRQRSESFQRLRRGCRHDEEAKIAPGRADFIDSIERTNHEGRAAARAETVEGKKAGGGKLRPRGSVVEHC
jgi:predicted negative regulator of RcsB-dependent stress response